ncbi:hypothetical protein Tco_1156023 [Tanacetum coccineum]
MITIARTSAPTRETSAPLAPKTAKQLAAKRNQERVKSILLLAIPDEYLLKFHNVADAKSLGLQSKQESDEENTIYEPTNDRFSKAMGFIMFPNIELPKKPQNLKSDISFAGLDEYAIRKKITESKTTDLNTKTSETVGKTNEANTQKPKTVYELVNRDKVIIKDWNSDDEDDVSEVSPVKTNETQTAKTQVDKIGQTSKKAGIGFKKIKACFVCKSTDHLIKDCDFYDKKSPKPKLKNVVNTGQRVVKPVWDNTKRVNDQNFSKYPHLRKTFVPSGVLTITGLVNPARPNEKRAVQTINTTRPVSTVRPFAPKITQTSGAIRPIYPRMDNVRPRASYSSIKRAVVNTGKGKMENDLKKSKACWVWRPKLKVLDHDSKNSGSYILQAISATIDGHEQFITEASLRRHLKLEDAEGISSFSNEKIFEQLAHMRFIQLLLNKQQRLLLPHTRTYPTPTLTSKLFSNMRRASKGYSGVVTPLFESMLVQAHDEEQQQSPSRITSSPSLSPQPTQPSPSPEPIQPTHEAEETASMPYDSPLHVVHSHGSAEGSMQQHDLTVLVNKLNDRIDGLEKDLQQTKKTYSTALTKLVLRVKKLEYKLKSGKARRKAKIEEEVHEKPNDETEVIVQEETPTEIIKEHGSGEKGEMEISTASPPKVTKVSTVEAHVYTRRSAKDKGKAIIKEPATPKKVKKRTQVQLSMDEELARKMEEEERARFNAEHEARALQEEEEEERLNMEVPWELRKTIWMKDNKSLQKLLNLKELTWNDPMRLQEKLLQENEHNMTSDQFLFLKVEEEKVEKEDVKPDPKKIKESDDFEQEKEDLRMWLSVLKDEEVYVTQEFLFVRYPIVNWEYQLHGRMEMKDMEAYKLTRADELYTFHGGNKVINPET